MTSHLADIDYRIIQSLADAFTHLVDRGIIDLQGFWPSRLYGVDVYTLAPNQLNLMASLVAEHAEVLDRHLYPHLPAPIDWQAYMRDKNPQKPLFPQLLFEGNDHMAAADEYYSVDLQNDRFLLRFDRHSPALLWVKRLNSSHRQFINDADVRWEVSVNDTTRALVYKLREELGLTLSPQASSAIRHLWSSADFDKLPLSSQEIGRKAVLDEQGRLQVFFPYDQTLVDKMSEMGGVFRKTPAAHWRFPTNFAPVVELLQQAGGFTIASEVRQAADAQEEAKVVNLEWSVSVAVQDTAVLAQRYLEGRFPVRLEPREHQLLGVDFLVRNKSTVLADEQGLGKTFQALVAANHLNTFPLLVICRASLKRNWEREIIKTLQGPAVYTIYGLDTAVPAGYDIYIVNYALLGARKKRGQKRPGILTPVGQQLAAMKFDAVIVDEAQRLKNTDTITYKACAELAVNAKHRFALTASPVEIKTSELQGVMQWIGKFDGLGGWRHFITYYCGGYQYNIGRKTIWQRDGWQSRISGALKRSKANGSTSTDVAEIIETRNHRLTELNERMRKQGMYMRRTVEQLVGGNIQLILNPVYISQADFQYPAYRQLEDEFVEYLLQFDDIGVALSYDPAKALGLYGALWQKASEVKAAYAAQYVKDRFIETETKVVVFAYHKVAQAALAKALPKQPSLIGDNASADERRFMEQAGEDNVAILCSLAAHHAGFTLTAAHQMVMVGLHWNPQIMRQAYGRAYGRTNDPHSLVVWHLLAQNTIDEDMWYVLERRRNSVNQILGEKATLTVAEETELNMREAVITRLISRAKLA